MSESGFLVVNKPGGPTSHDIVAHARRATGITKIGHAGTLDPPATGVLVLALGRATRLIRYVQDQDKEYVASLKFGVATSTLDATGEEVERFPMAFGKEELTAALHEFRGEIQQVPPMVSALKVGGRRLYDLARQGQEVEREPRMVHIEELELEAFEGGDFPLARIRVVCSKGTYIRSLADDIAASLGGRAHLQHLTRTRIGNLTIEKALAPDSLESWHDHLLPVLVAAAGMKAVTVTGQEAAGVRNGRPLPGDGGQGPLAVLDQSGNLIAVYQRHGTQARAEVVLV